MKMGTPNPESGWVGKFREFRVPVEFPQKALIWVILGNSFRGPHFGSDMLGRGDNYLVS